MAQGERVLEDRTVGGVGIGDRSVRRLGFGAMRISGARNAEGVRDREEARRIARRVVERGVQFIDTANIYGYGESEEILAEALSPYREDLLIATKAGYRPGKILAGHQTLPPFGDPQQIREECEKSLRRLRVEAIELYQVHVPDPNFPWADTVGAFVRLQEEGKVRQIGVSNVSLAQLEIARGLCDVVSVQNRYNPGDREFDEVLAACESGGIAFLPWAPMGSGRASVARVVESVARDHGVGPQQVALRWLLHRSPIMLPIPGTSSLVHLDENIDAAWVEIDEAALEQIDRAWTD